MGNFSLFKTSYVNIYLLTKCTSRQLRAEETVILKILMIHSLNCVTEP